MDGAKLLGDAAAEVAAVGGAGVCAKAEQKPVVLRNALVPSAGGGYARRDVVLSGGKIDKVLPANTADADADGAEVVECTERMLLPGFVNGHTHSVEHWARGLIKPLPLELWVLELILNEPRGERGWCGPESWVRTPSAAVALSALHCGVEALLSGCTAVMDHLLCRNIDDVAAAVAAYRALGVRAFIAPMLGDDAANYHNYIPMAPDAAARNAACARRGCSCGGMAEGGAFRTVPSQSDAQKTREAIKLWEEAADRFHDPENGIEIVVGPVTAYSASTELLKAAADIRRRRGLCGHTHLLETRGQALMARQKLPSGSAVRHLYEAGFLQLPGTTCAHSIWLDDDEMKLMAEAGASAVHNPWSNLRLGSGVMPLARFAAAGVNVCLGADGSCSSDGQDMIEVMKLATVLPAVETPEYRQWPNGNHTALTLGAANGYKALNMEGRGGVIAEGAVADVTLWDLTSLALLPRTDPLSLLVLGSRTQAPDAGSTLSDAWVDGRRVVKGGSPVGVDLEKLRDVLRRCQQSYRDPAETDPSTHPDVSVAETEYRAAMGLDTANAEHGHPEEHQKYPPRCTLYDPTLP